jgi:hypothetical protein
LICKIKDEKSNYLGELYSNCAKHTLHYSNLTTGSPPEQICGKENARSLALQSAKQEALQNLFEVTKDVRIDSNTHVKKFALESDIIKLNLQEMIRDAKVTNREYMSDGTVEVTMLMSLHGGFAQLVLPADIKQIVTR